MDSFLKINELDRVERYLLYGLQRHHYSNESNVKNVSVILEDGLYHIKNPITV